MNLLFNKKNLLTLGIFLILVFLIIYFGLLPLARKTSSLYKSNKEKKAQLENEQSINSDLQKVQKTIAEQKSSVERVINYIPLKNETEFLNQIEALAAKGNNKLESFKFIEGKDKKTLVSVSGVTEKQFEIIVSGSYPSINNFINGLDKLIQFNNIYNLSISSDSNGTKATLSGAIYLRQN